MSTEEYISKNGYKYVKVDGRWIGFHRVLAEKKLGRPLQKDERVTFKDKDKTNFDPDNIVVRTVKLKTVAARRARIEAKIADLQVELADLDAEES